MEAIHAVASGTVNEYALLLKPATDLQEMVQVASSPPMWHRSISSFTTTDHRSMLPAFAVSNTT